MKKYLRALNVLFFLFLLRVMISCCMLSDCNCGDDTIPYTFNRTKIVNIDNSGVYSTETSSNELKRAAVAFSLKLSDTNFTYFDYYAVSSKPIFGFPGAYAYTKDCEPIFESTLRINSIAITTLQDINDSIFVGQDVTEQFLVRLNSNPQSTLYKTLESALTQIRYKGYPFVVINFYLIIPVENNSAQFSFIINLSDGSVLTASTNSITIID